MTTPVPPADGPYSTPVPTPLSGPLNAGVGVSPTTISDAVKVYTIPAFTDNYFWLLACGKQALVVDPGAAAPVLAALKALDLILTDILITHHHPDHIGGLAELRARTGAKAYGPADDRIPGLSHRLSAGAKLIFWPDSSGQAQLELNILDLSGHTSSHIGYVRAGTDRTWLFCGDTLFGGGCGRLFDGTAAQLYASLDRIRQLPATTLVFCAHEYTAANLRFGAAVEPDNSAIRDRQKAVAELRAQGRPSVPFSLEGELATNPFLRLKEPAVLAAAKAAVGTHCPATTDDPVVVLACLRTLKNTFS